ncbi:hypothetical protein VTK73DRAFT_8693 [Phialemonium thermophilum]|uniref:Ribosome biogenesis protein SLX9 n=1 Tax=Phialemonium thermophilum TaxID=223376 RepID=A0ABR3W773_9PEZI
MAPTAPTPGKRPSARAKALARLQNPLLPRKVHRPDNAVTDSFLDTKRDRRTIRRSAFLSRVAKSSSSSASGTQRKRRRPNKKLVATLESLGDALGEIEAESAKEGQADAMDEAQARAGKVRHRSLRSRPGALKRKEKLVRGEMERFQQSLAHLATIRKAETTTTAAAAAATTATTATATMETNGQASSMEVEAEGHGGADAASSSAAATAAAPTSGRWAALRGFIAATMEQNPAFLAKG